MDDRVSQADLDCIADPHNHRPRKVPGFRTLFEVFYELVRQTSKITRPSTDHETVAAKR
ncbi:MAG: hypothetical protein WCA78_04335 [Rhizomicrobium sp.]|jgi:hypothetical protein